MHLENHQWSNFLLDVGKVLSFLRKGNYMYSLCLTPWIAISLIFLLHWHVNRKMRKMKESVKGENEGKQRKAKGEG